MYIYMRIHIYIPLMCMNILIYGYGHLTSSIWSEYPSEQIRTSSPEPVLLSLVLLELDPAKLIQLKIGQFLAFETLISKVSYENGS